MKKIVLASLAASALLFGAESELKTHTELSYVNTKGNTDTESFALEAKADKSYGKHVFHLKAEAFYSKDGETETKNKWLAELAYDYEFTKRFAFNYLLGYKQDKFSAFDAQLYTGPGAKYKVVDAEAHKLNFQANILYSRDEIKTPETTEDYTSWQAAFDYNWQIMENLKFTQEANYRSSFEDSENYFVTSKTSLANKINSTLSLGLSYKVDYANSVATGIERTDRTFLTSLIIDY